MHDDDQKGGFVQFPLCLLATRDPLEEWMMRAFRYAVVHFINQTKTDEETFVESLERARKMIQFKGGLAGEFQDCYFECIRNIAEWTNAHGKTFPTRIPTDWIIDTRNTEMLSEIQLRLLLGINSLIGMKKYVKAGYPMLQARAAGWLRPLTASELCMTKHIGSIYSRGQIDRACRELVARGFIKTFTFNRGERWWTNKMTAEELAMAIAQLKLWRHVKVTSQSELNSRVSAEIIAARQSRT